MTLWYFPFLLKDKIALNSPWLEVDFISTHWLSCIGLETSWLDFLGIVSKSPIDMNSLSSSQVERFYHLRRMMSRRVLMTSNYRFQLTRPAQVSHLTSPVSSNPDSSTLYSSPPPLFDPFLVQPRDRIHTFPIEWIPFNMNAFTRRTPLRRKTHHQ